MASTVPVLPFLRPLAPPRPSTIQRFLRFSTSARQCEQLITTQQGVTKERSSGFDGRVSIKGEDPNLVASRTADSAYPPSSMRSMPRPKNPKASRRASLPPKDRSYPTRGATHEVKVVAPLIPPAIQCLAAEQCAPNLPYFVNRTWGNELPVYQERKRGGDMLRTLVRKIDGNVELLRDELRMELGLAAGDAVVNPVTRHIHLKGHHKPKVQQYLWKRRF